MSIKRADNLKLTELQKAYLAGFLESKRFTPNYESYSVTTTFNFHMQEVVQKVAKLCGAKIHVMNGSTFGEVFANANRPAVYTDSHSPRLYFYWRGRNAQKIIKAIYPYLSSGTRQRFKPLLNKVFLTPQQSGRIGGLATKGIKKPR